MKLVLAGAQRPVLMKSLMRMKAPSILFSYFYFRGMKDSETEEILQSKKTNGTWGICDSGAYSFFQIGHQVGEAKHTLEKMNVTPDQYFVEYLAWLKKFGHYFEATVELDLGVRVVDYDKALGWRKELMATGLPIMPVYHHRYENTQLNGSTSPKDRKDIRVRLVNEICDGVDYIGLEGAWSVADYADLLRITNERKVRVHCFGSTNKDVFKYLSFYSIDSISWMMGEKFGTTFVCRNGVLRRIGHEKKDIRKNYKDHCTKFGIDFDQLLLDKRNAVNEFNASMWILYQKDIDRTHRNDPCMSWTVETKAVTSASSTTPATVQSTEIVKVSRPTKRDADDTADFGYWCNNCIVADKCPYFKKDAACSVPFSHVSRVDGQSRIQAMFSTLLDRLWERMNFAMAAEKARGGQPDPEVSRLVTQFMDITEKMNAISNPTATLTVKATGISGGSATAATGGVLSRMFGGGGGSSHYAGKSGTHPSMRRLEQRLAPNGANEEVVEDYVHTVVEVQGTSEDDEA